MCFSKTPIIRNCLLPSTAKNSNCPTIRGQLGSSVLLPLTSEGISNSTNKSIHITVTMAKSAKSNRSNKLVSLDLPKEGSLSHLEDGYKFHLENLSLVILESKKTDEGWYHMSLEEQLSIQSFCLQLKLYGNNGGFPSPKGPKWTLA